MKLFVVFALFVAAAAAQLGQAPHPALSRFINREATVIDAADSDVGVSASGVPTVRLNAAQIADAKAFYVTKPIGTAPNTVGIFRAVSSCTPPMRLAGLESYIQASNVLNNLKDAVTVDRNFWIANTRAGGATAADYFLITKGTSVPMATITTSTGQPTLNWNAPAGGLGTNDCVQVQFKAAAGANAASVSLTAVDCMAATSAANVLCEMDWASTNPLFDRVF